MAFNDKSLLTMSEAAREIRCSKAHLSNIIRGKVPRLPILPVVRIGRRLLVRYSSLLQWLVALEERNSGVR
jgi:hypothetical protein